MRSLRIAKYLLAALVASAATAHDVWFEPTTFFPAVDERVGLGLRVGMKHAGEPMPRMSDRIVRFVAIDPDGQAIDVPGLEGRDPAGLIAPSKAGRWVVGYRSNDSLLELDAAKFEHYLEEEGLQWVVAERLRRGESAKPSREKYSRAVKAILAVAGSDRGQVTRPLGFTLELVPEQDPYTLTPGAKLGMRLLYEGKPLAGTQFEAFPKSDPTAMQKGRTGKDGRFAVTLGTSGPWLIKAVHMIAAKGDPEADWKSLWASLAFSVKD
jgi:uncharacterized GH25 family protein